MTMKQTERIEFIRNSSHFVMLANPHFDEILDFKLLSIHFNADKAVILIKHARKVVCVARHQKDLRAQNILRDINLLSVEQLSGQSIPRLNFIIEYEATPRGQISSINYRA